MPTRVLSRRAGWLALAVALPLAACSSGSPAPDGSTGAPPAAAGSAASTGAATGASASATRAPVTGTPTASATHAGATVSRPIADSVGPLFDHGLGADHDCTASVLHSTTGTLLITAAHCVTGSGQGIQFAPGYTAGRTPFGVWTVQHAFVSASWIADQDPEGDVTILQVGRQQVGGTLQSVEQVTGAATLGTEPGDGSAIRAIAYNSGLDDQAITCATTVHYDAGQPMFDCHGFVSGSSGAPWLHHDPVRGTWTVQGVIGGRNQGGCQEYSSYSAPFTAAVGDLLTRAQAGTDPDTLPTPDSDGC